MRLRFWVITLTALLMATTAMAANGYPPRTGGNYNGVRWYGYYTNVNGNANDSAIPDNYSSTNITEVWSSIVETNACITFDKSVIPCGDSPDCVTNSKTAHQCQMEIATNVILSNLATAAMYNEKAIVDVGNFVFQINSGCATFCYGDDPTAAADFGSLVNTLIDKGYLVPNNPAASTVVAFYVADEPEINGLQDTSNGPAPALVDAVTAIRQNANTTNFPLAAILQYDSAGNIGEGEYLFDWLGLDDYDDFYQDYLTHVSDLEKHAGSPDVVGGTAQEYFMVPLVTTSTGNLPYIGAAPSLYQRFLTDSQIIGIMPYNWGGMDDGGASWAAEYTNLGREIVYPPAPAETTGVINYVIAQ